MEFSHQPVLPEEVMEYLVTPGGSRYLDGTLGGGGHARLLLQQVPVAEVLGIDRDDAALKAARECLAEFGERAHVARGTYADMTGLAAELGWKKVDGILLDIGVSSFQIDTPERGFSLRHDGPLDMRMDWRLRVTAASILNTTEEAELARIFWEYGEERKSRQVARAVVNRRKERPWMRTGEFAEMLDKVVGRTRHGPPAPTRCFQALRIVVNGELEQLEKGLRAAVDLLNPGGRLVVISFHSLEDRMVKRFFRDEAKS